MRTEYEIFMVDIRGQRVALLVWNHIRYIGVMVSGLLDAD